MKEKATLCVLKRYNVLGFTNPGMILVLFSCHCNTNVLVFFIVWPAHEILVFTAYGQNSQINTHAYSSSEDRSRPLVKGTYIKNDFLISQLKHMLWVLKRTALLRLFF